MPKLDTKIELYENSIYDSPMPETPKPDHQPQNQNLNTSRLGKFLFQEKNTTNSDDETSASDNENG